MDPIRRGMQGGAVGGVQQMLIEAGYAVPAAELSSVLFGPGTEDAVRSYQASHLGPNHKPLVEDGIVGQATWWALQHPNGDTSSNAPEWRWDPSLVRPAVLPALTAAVSQLGIREVPDGSNDGPDIRKFTAPDFIGSPWCALFASWCFSHLDGGSPFGRLAATWGIYNWGKRTGRLLSTAAMPQPGDIALILRGSENDPNHRGHTMIVSGMLPDGRLLTIAGNESNCVRGGVRERSNLNAFVRPVPLV